MAFIVRKMHLGTDSDEKNFIWKIIVRECTYLALRLLKYVWVLNTEVFKYWQFLNSTTRTD